MGIPLRDGEVREINAIDVENFLVFGYLHHLYHLLGDLNTFDYFYEADRQSVVNCAVRMCMVIRVKQSVLPKCVGSLPSIDSVVL